MTFKYHLYKVLHALGLVSKKKYAKMTRCSPKDYKLIKKSKFFDAAWYLDRNLDVKASKMDPVVHYLTCGWKENRQPSSSFDGNRYLLENPDVAGSGMNPLLHYEKFGRFEGRTAGVINGVTQPPRRTTLWERICQIARYPLEVEAECRRLEAELRY